MVTCKKYTRFYRNVFKLIVLPTGLLCIILLSYSGSNSSFNPSQLCDTPKDDYLLNYEYNPELNYSNHDILERNPSIQYGGFWHPQNCAARYHTALIIPFRDRVDQLPILLGHLHPFMQYQLISYRIFVVEQIMNDVPFNKAMLMNIAATIVSDKFPLYDCFIFHDVDMIPEDARNLYRCGRFPRHLSPAVDEFNYTMPYPTIAGGVLAITKQQFKFVNGFSNMYWGWGGEDDDMYYRIKYSNLFLSRPSEEIGRYTMLKHTKRIRWGPRINLLIHAAVRFRNDGLAQLKTMNYTVISVINQPLLTNILVDIQSTTVTN